ncbi:hypothetical protein HYALB_00006507 [Hymenoscyphus albidus]|uniref:Uncharacterized protein n=1 Tax=Hymenoscyphus albidus TaxID=595503 RepID=A0A9N9LI37_9HELO|nr:hypothetical protein HYALB_00006507 [Hymenoscyphus albidus]
MVNFRLVSSAEAPQTAEGSILFLPPRDIIPKDAFVDEELNAGAFNHPVVVTSCPSPKKIKHDSVVEIAIMTSFNNTLLKKYLAQKGIVCRYFEMRGGKGMKRDCSYVGVRRSYKISLRALAKYGNHNEEVDAYRLTAHATRAVNEAIGTWKEKCLKVEKKSEKAREKKLEKPKKEFEKEGGKLVAKKTGKTEGKETKKIPDTPKAKIAKSTLEITQKGKVVKVAKTKPSKNKAGDKLVGKKVGEPKEKEVKKSPVSPKPKPMKQSLKATEKKTVAKSTKETAPEGDIKNTKKSATNLGNEQAALSAVSKTNKAIPVKASTKQDTRKNTDNKIKKTKDALPRRKSSARIAAIEKRMKDLVMLDEL